MAAAAGAAVRRPGKKTYYSSRGLKYLPEAEWTIMQQEIGKVLSHAHLSEYYHYVQTALATLPDAKASHIPGNWYWVHAATIFLHWLCFPKAYYKYAKRFPSVPAAGLCRLLTYALPKVQCAFLALMSFYITQFGPFIRRWMHTGRWAQRVAIGKQHFRGILAGVGSRNPDKSATLIVCRCDVSPSVLTTPTA